MKKSFSLNKKQQAALASFEKAAQRLTKSGVTLLFDYEANEVFACGMTKSQERHFQTYCNCDPPENPEEFEDVTAELLDDAVNVNICGTFIDSDIIFGFEKD